MNDINELIRLYVKGEADAAQTAQVQAYLLNNTEGLSILINAIRQNAMNELGLDSEADFLPELIREATGQTYTGEACADKPCGENTYDYLCREVLGD